MFAVVEPYVIAAQLQAEVLKKGLNMNVTGAGCSTSIVASACAYAGQGPYAHFMGGNAENVLGMEWVTPEGEIIRTGSLGSGDGWFCSEGPGPSVRGICRGSHRLPGRPRRVHQVRRQAGAQLRRRRMAGGAAPCPPTGFRWRRRSAPTRWPSRAGTPGPTSTTRSTTTRSATSSTASSTSPAPTSRPPSG